MLKLIIADDERVIRETISTIIDWEKYDIELIGLCKNGLEAYDTILDEAPDIVLTDIRMPGMDAMELLEKVSEVDSPPQFILLSGYGEFEYAKKAMKYGVKHYLLKPCNQVQILESIQDVAKDCYQKHALQYRHKEQFATANHMSHNVIFNIINDTIYRSQAYEDTFRVFEPFLDFHFTEYKLVYVYYLEREHLEEYLVKVKEYRRKKNLYVTFHGIYTHNTLIFFFKSYTSEYQEFLDYLASIRLPGQQVCQQIEMSSYRNLSTLLPEILDKVRRYSIIYYIHSFRVITCCNYGYVTGELEQLLNRILSGEADKLKELPQLLTNMNDLEFLKQTFNRLLLNASLNNPQLSTVQLTEFLIVLNKEASLTKARLRITDFLGTLLPKLSRQKATENTGSMVQQIYDYVEKHLSDPNLTLKSISDQHLYMNTDYVSRKFQKETGMKFSSYLTDLRIKKAKEYLAASNPEKIQNVAKMVGCGNNPQYFSQLFRKHTGITPSAYVAEVHGWVEEE